MELNGIKFDPKKVAEAKARFHHNRRPNAKSYRARFDRLLRMYSDPRITLREIGEYLKSSSQWARVIFKENFQHLFPGSRKSLRRRKLLRTVREREALAASLPQDRLTRDVAAVGRNWGYTVSLIPRSGDSRFYFRALDINGHRSRVCVCTSAIQPPRSLRLYARFRLKEKALRDFEFLFLKTAVEGYPQALFIVPTSVVRKEYGGKKGGWITLYIPLDNEAVHHGQTPRVSWWSFVGMEGWEQLKAAPR